MSYEIANLEGEDIDVREYLAVYRLAPMKKRISGEDYFLWKQETEGRRPLQELMDGFTDVVTQSDFPQEIVDQMEADGFTEAQIDQVVAELTQGSDAVDNKIIINNPINGEQITIQKTEEGVISFDRSDSYIYCWAKAQVGEMSYIDPTITYEKLANGLHKFHNNTQVGIMGTDGVEMYDLLDAPSAKGLSRKVVHWKSHERAVDHPQGWDWINPTYLAGTGAGSSEHTSGKKDYIIVSTDPTHEVGQVVDGEEIHQVVNPIEVPELRIFMNIYIREKMGYHTVFIFNTNS